MEEVVGFVHKMGVVARLQKGVTTKLIEVKHGLVKLMFRLVDMAIKVVIRLILMMFCFILK